MKKLKIKPIHLMIGVIILFILNQGGMINFQAITGSEVLTRDLPTSVAPGQTFNVLYKSTGTSGLFTAGFRDDVTGGCTPDLIVKTTDEAIKTVQVTAPSSGTCTFKGTYSFGGSGVENILPLDTINIVEDSSCSGTNNGGTKFILPTGTTTIDLPGATKDHYASDWGIDTCLEDVKYHGSLLKSYDLLKANMDITITVNAASTIYIPIGACTDTSWSPSTLSVCEGITFTQTLCGETRIETGTKDCTVQPCTEEWDCADWSSCSGNTQTRTCTESNNCGTTTYKPETSRDCTVDAYCGDGTCNTGEDCSSCDEDCGTCTDPDPEPTITTCTSDEGCEFYEKCDSGKCAINVNLIIIVFVGFMFFSMMMGQMK